MAQIKGLAEGKKIAIEGKQYLVTKINMNTFIVETEAGKRVVPMKLPLAFVKEVTKGHDRKTALQQRQHGRYY